MLRQLRPDLRIGFFMDIPFPPHELFMQLPWRRDTIQGLLGADVVGFHQPRSASNFQSLARTVLGLEARAGTIQVEDRQVRVIALPGSIDSAGVAAVARSPEVLGRAKQIRADLGNPHTVILGAQRIGHVDGIGELDHILGIDNRLQALHELLVDGRLDPEKLVVVELVGFVSKADSRRYLQLGGGIENTVARINGKFASPGRPVVHYLQRAMSPEELIAFYLSADVLAVTPMRDGMNLVAKEYVASRNDLDGALVLSEFSGAAAELTSAFLVNTYDLDRVKGAMYDAITIDPAEGRRRMRALRRQVLTHDSDRWARAFLAALDSAAATPR
jgi:trehalose 6-phosphate synthase